MDKDALDAHLDAELRVGVGGVEALSPWCEVEVAAPVEEAPAVQQTLPDLRL
jgi:hypothetical protein